MKILNIETKFFLKLCRKKKIDDEVISIKLPTFETIINLRMSYPGIFTEQPMRI